MKLKIILAYVGTQFHGWQIQRETAHPDTIQGILEAALLRLSGSFVRVHGSGRTDAGVHAEGQVAHFELSEEQYLRVRDWRHALNALLPHDITIYSIEPVADDFHARFSAHNKSYRYLFWQERAFLPPRLVPFVWSSGPLCLKAMQEGLQYLLGSHDFASFANAGTEMEDTTRTLLEASIQEVQGESYWPAHLPMLALQVTGTGFLKQMVRNIAGMLADLGRGKMQVAQVSQILEAKQRSALRSATAPAKGLSLIQVSYWSTSSH